MADSDTTQHVDIKKLHAEAKAIFAIANCGLKLAELGADSDTTQHVGIKKLHAEAKAIFANCVLKLAERGAEAKREAREKLSAEAKREAREKLSAEMKAFIANCRQKRAEREAPEKALAEAEPLLTTSQWLSAIFIAASLAGF